MEATLRGIKAVVDVPVILFPSKAEVVTPGADAIFFMSLLNSRSPRYLMREQKKAAPAVRQAGLEPIPLGYLVVEPGMRVGEIGQADLVPRGEVDEAVRYALAAEYFGMAIVYLEAGSGAPDPVPLEMVSAVRAAASVLVAVGGGVQRPDQAFALASAGADIIVTGTLVERGDGIDDTLGPIIEALRAWRSP
jgi:phosphoglycerol geranylgeranyltransferase